MFSLEVGKVQDHPENNSKQIKFKSHKGNQSKLTSWVQLAKIKYKIVKTVLLSLKQNIQNISLWNPYYISIHWMR